MNEFSFRIIKMNDGTQIIDRNLSTPYKALSPVQLAEYTEVELSMYYMDSLRRKEERKNKINSSKTILERIISFCVAL